MQHDTTLLVCAVLVAALAWPIDMGAATTAEGEVAQLREIYDRHLAKIRSQFEREAKAWPALYRQELEALRIRFREGGSLEVRTGKSAGMAWAEITNSGQIPEAEISRILSADVSGRGLNIVYRFARSLGGLVEVRVDAEKDTTTFRISLPLQEEP